MSPYGLSHQVTVPGSLLVAAHTTAYDPASQMSLIDGVPLAEHPNVLMAGTITSTFQTGPNKNDTASDEND
jgi:putative ATP-grasp target RiPP